MLSARLSLNKVVVEYEDWKLSAVWVVMFWLGFPSQCHLLHYLLSEFRAIEGRIRDGRIYPEELVRVRVLHGCVFALLQAAEAGLLKRHRGGL